MKRTKRPASFHGCVQLLGSALLGMLRLRWCHWLCCPFSHPGPSFLPSDAWPKKEVLTRSSLGSLFFDPGGVLLIDGWSVEPSESCSLTEGLRHLSLSPLAPSPPYGGHHPASLELS